MRGIEVREDVMTRIRENVMKMTGIYERKERICKKGSTCIAPVVPVAVAVLVAASDITHTHNSQSAVTANTRSNGTGEAGRKGQDGVSDT